MRYVVVLLLIARVASAHQSSTKYLDVDTSGDDVVLSLELVPNDVTEPMKLPVDSKPSAQAAVASPAVAPYVQTWVAGCANKPAVTSIADAGFIAVTWPAVCGDEFTLDFTAFFSLDQKMEILVSVDGGDARRITVRDRTIAIAHKHVPISYERIAFVILIVLACATWRRTAFAFATYSVAFAIGSATGIALEYAPQIVAATVIYASLEVLFARGDWRWRTATFSVFGVIHGIAHTNERSILTFNIVGILVAGALTFAVLLPLRRLAPIVRHLSLPVGSRKPGGLRSSKR